MKRCENLTQTYVPNKNMEICFERQSLFPPNGYDFTSQLKEKIDIRSYCASEAGLDIPVYIKLFIHLWYFSFHYVRKGQHCQSFVETLLRTI